MLQRAIQAPHRTRPVHILALQRAAGNRAVSRLIQAKLTVGPVGDRYEQEADRVAERVMDMSIPSRSPSLQRQEKEQVQMSPLAETITPLVQRQEEEEEVQMSSLVQRQEEEEEVQMSPLVQRQEEEEIQTQPSLQRRSDGAVPAGRAFESRLNSAKGGGQPLPPTFRAEFEPKFGADFGGVRVHTDAESAQLNRAVHAKAFTHGQDIYMGSGTYAPATTPGKRLLAHELTHTIQQVGAKQVRRTQEDGKPDSLPPLFDPANFKKETYVRASTRGSYVSTIDKWLQAVHGADSWTKQQHALTQVVAACDAWLDKHKDQKQKKERRSVTKRRLPIKLLRAKAVLASSAMGGLVPSRQTGVTKESGDGDDYGTEMAGETFSSIASGAGITGDYADRNLLSAPDSYSGNYMDKEGGAKLNQPAFDILEGANVVTGGLTIKSAFKDIADPTKSTREKVEAGGQALAGGGQIIHGAYKATKGVAILSGGDSTKWTQVGDIGAAYADGTATIAGLISTVKGILDFKDQYKEMSRQEKIEAGLELAGTMTQTVQSGLNTGKDIVKAVTKVGETGGKEAIAGMATASGILSIISGTIEMAQGGYKLYRGFAAKRAVKKAENKEKELLSNVSARLALVKSRLPALFDIGDRSEILKIGVELRRLKATLDQMKAAHEQYAPALEAMKKIQNRRMEEGAFKLAKGVTGVVSGALLVSGVGAPIAVSVAALGSIIALGHAGLKWRRSKAASRLATVALRLTAGGMPKAKPDEQTPSYREMEKRVYKCYYLHIPEVLTKKSPAGMSSGEFSDVKKFAWEDKKKRVDSGQKVAVRTVAEAGALDESTRRDNWIEVRNRIGRAIHREKPKGWTKVGFKLSASAHKSKQAMQASKADIADALYALGSQSFNEEKKAFVDAPIVPVGDAEPEALAEFGQVTLNALLSSASVTPARWMSWRKKAGDDEAKMKKLIIDHIG